MMPALQYLRHGKALCGKVFKRFVETFNYHNDFIANLKIFTHLLFFLLFFLIGANKEEIHSTEDKSID